MRRIAILTLFTLLSSAWGVYGQDSTSSKGELTISGYVDAYYTYNLNTPPHSTGFGVDNTGRIFDIKHNQFSLGMAQTKFSYTKGKLAGVVDLAFGPNAELGNFGNVFGSMITIKQAYMDYNFTNKLKFTIGQFGTHVGYELIDAPLNYNYSLSYLFGNGPFYHTGAKLSYSVSDKFGVMAGIVNGWDEMYDFNKSKSFIAQIYVAPVDGLNIYLNYIGGDEKNGFSFPTIGTYGGTTIKDSIKTPSHLFDLTGTYEVNDKFKIGLNAAYGMGRLLPDPIVADKYNNATWWGTALYLNYAVSDKFGLGLRAEHFDDSDGVRYITASTGVPTTYNEITLTGNISLADGMFLIKPEFRIDMAGKNVYVKYKDGIANKATSTQATIGSAFIFKF